MPSTRTLWASVRNPNAHPLQLQSFNSVLQIIKFFLCFCNFHFPTLFEHLFNVMQDFINLFREVPDIDAGLAASVFHFGEIAIPDLKRTLSAEGINMRLI